MAEYVRDQYWILKYAVDEVRRYNSIPKFQVYNNALLTTRNEQICSILPKPSLLEQEESLSRTGRVSRRVFFLNFVK